MALALMRSGPRVGWGYRKVTWETREERPISALVPADLIALGLLYPAVPMFLTGGGAGGGGGGLSL